MKQTLITIVFLCAVIFDLIPKIQRKEKKTAIITALFMLSGYTIIMLDAFDLPVSKPLQEFHSWVSALLFGDG
ncbi:MAG: hypothetical protein LBC56_03020 [Oscillospiraceae bacterium]|nr:hypothetical protein [Oscillospiraceae bacterium]